MKFSFNLIIALAVVLAILCIFTSCAPAFTDGNDSSIIDTSSESKKNNKDEKDEPDFEEDDYPSKSDTEVNTETESDSNSGTNKETDTSSENDTDTAVESDTNTKESDTNSEVDTNISSEVETDSESNTETDTDSDTELYPPEPHAHLFENYLYGYSGDCMTLGFSVYGCTCGETITTYSDKYGDHNYNIVFDTVLPTCTESGYTIYVCACGEGIRNDFTPTLGHDYVNALEIPPTCNEQGFTRYSCRCGDFEDRDFIDSPGHTYGNWEVYFKPSTVSEGEERRTCSFCGEHEARPIAKITLYYSFSKEDDKNVLTVSSGAPSSYSSTVEPSDVFGEALELSLVDKLVLGENITEISSLTSFTSVKEIVFSSDVQKINSFAIYNCEILDKMYFEGDAPILEDSALTINSQKAAVVIPSENSKGFGNGLLFGIQPLYRNVPSEIPEMSLNDYAKKTASESVELTKEIVELFKSKGQKDLLIIPYTADMAEYAEIKNFTLELTKNCSSDVEKANTIFAYLTENVIYDTNYTFNTPYEVFKTKRAVCAGYVGLMHDMLSSVGIAAFYTRGMTVFGCTETVETLLKETYTSTTHAWLSVYFENGDVKFYDPTWGVDLGYDYMEMSASELGGYAVTFEVGGLEVIIDEVDFSMIGGVQHQFLYTDGKIYNLSNGQISLISGSTVINDWYLDIIEVAASNGSEVYLNGERAESGVAVNNGLYSFGYESSQFLYAAADGKIYHPYTLFNYLKTQATVFGEDITLTIDGLIYDNGLVFAKNEKGTYGAIAYLGDEKEIIIPAEINGIQVVSVNAGFLEYNDTVTHVTLSEGIEYVARYTFSKASSLEYVYLPSTVNIQAVNQYIVFDDCVNLKEIVVSPDNPYMCSLDGNLYSKDMKMLLAFASKSASTFVLPTSVEIIMESAFHSSSLEYIVLHDGLKEIGNHAFLYSTLKEIVIPANCKIGHSAFMYSSLRKVVIEDGVEEIGDSAFAYCQMLTSVKLPSTLKSISDTAFLEATSLYEIVLPQGVEYIAYGAFAYSGLTSITLSESLTDIGIEAFLKCCSLFHINNLSSLELTKGSEEYGMIALNVITMSDTVDDTHVIVQDDFVFYVGDEIYLTNYIGASKDVVLPESFNSKAYKLSPYAFVGSSTIKWVVYGYVAPMWINERDHYGKNVESITIPSTINEIPDYCFEGWDSLTTVYYDKPLLYWNTIKISSTGNSAILNAELKEK